MYTQYTKKLKRIKQINISHIGHSYFYKIHITSTTFSYKQIYKYVKIYKKKKNQERDIKLVPAKDGKGTGKR